MPCHVVRDVRCQADQRSSQVCHLSQSVSGGIWQPALHQEASRAATGWEGRQQNRWKERQRREEKKKSDHIKVAGGDSNTTLVTKSSQLAEDDGRWLGGQESCGYYLHLSRWNYKHSKHDCLRSTRDDFALQWLKAASVLDVSRSLDMKFQHWTN